VSAELTNLRPATEYHYRLIASNLAVSTIGVDGSFTTLAAQQPPPPPPQCIVPKLTGDRLALAKRKLRAAHCRLGKVTKARAARRTRGKGHVTVVAKQSPKPGAVSAAGTKVSLTLTPKRAR
jgi:hypothetical protein